MIVTKNGMIEIPTPSLDLMVQTIRASVYGKDAKIALEMLFRKSSLYDLLRLSYGKGKSEDAFLLFNLWKNNPEYLTACTEHAAKGFIPLLPTADTIAAATNFVEKNIPDRADIYSANSYIVGGMVDGLRVPLASAAYFGSYFRSIRPKDIVAVQVLGITPEELECGDENGIIVSDSKGVKERYLELRRATANVESILFAVNLYLPIKLSVAVLNSDIDYARFMYLIRDEQYPLPLISNMIAYEIDPQIAQIIHDSASVGYQYHPRETLGLVAA